ncbi:MAG: nuclear transport factor 2 family protein [Planctomycetota bacterium]|nr:nuclear transport factor 2 family protein [Planctomycetota bacterium]MDA1211625.1 nuclear transport factor 2 family protein [Planctomycetota bacterium]
MISVDEIAIHKLLTEWTDATREGRQEDILSNHAPELLVFDVLPPLKYDSAESYRASWDDWQPDTQGEMTFHLEDLEITAGDTVGYAHGVLHCGGSLPDGKTFSDTVRATFCLRKVNGKWTVFHQHISKPYDRR